jgi:hypothetical protein
MRHLKYKSVLLGLKILQKAKNLPVTVVSENKNKVDKATITIKKTIWIVCLDRYDDLVLTREPMAVLQYLAILRRRQYINIIIGS